MIRVHLINCQQKLETMGIIMEERGHPDLLAAKIAEKISYEQGFLWYEYNFPPTDIILIFLADGATAPELSEFGEVFNVEYIEG
jgi:hypothetical protein